MSQNDGPESVKPSELSRSCQWIAALGIGGMLLGEAHAPAGSKRLSRLLQSKKCKARQVEDFLWERAETQERIWEQQG
jgi:hypothetical protein